MLLATRLLSKFMSSIVSIKGEDGTEYAQIFILKMQETGDRKMKDENLKIWKVQILDYN